MITLIFKRKQGYDFSDSLRDIQDHCHRYSYDIDDVRTNGYAVIQLCEYTPRGQGTVEKVVDAIGIEILGNNVHSIEVIMRCIRPLLYKYFGIEQSPLFVKESGFDWSYHLDKREQLIYDIEADFRGLTLRRGRIRNMHFCLDIDIDEAEIARRELALDLEM